MRIPVITYEYVPPGGDPQRPIVISGVTTYRPGEHGKGAEAYVFRIPDGLVKGLPTEWETDNFRGVLDNLANWFPGETKEGAEARLKLTYRDKVQFPYLD